jgi:L-aspartate oxidase
VFGALAAEAMIADAPAINDGSPVVPDAAEGGVTSEANTERWIAELRDLMWKHAGLLRDANGLREAQRLLDALAAAMPRGLSRRAVEARNLHTVASVVVASALGREESRGAHYRNDFPQRGAEAKHSVMEQGRLTFVA